MVYEYNGTKIFSVTIPKEKNIITKYFVVAKQQLYVSKNKQFSGILASSGSNYYNQLIHLRQRRNKSQ